MLLFFQLWEHQKRLPQAKDDYLYSRLMEIVVKEEKKEPKGEEKREKKENKK